MSTQAGPQTEASRYAFLADASTILASSLDYEITLKNVAALAVPRLADWCSIDLADGNGTYHTLTIKHVDPAKLRLADELRDRYPPDPNAPFGVAQVLRSGEAEMISEITEEMLVAGARDKEHLNLIRELGLSSYMIVPLITRGRILGAITFVAAESGHHYDESDLELAQDLARRAAVAVDNARLYSAAQQEIKERKRIEEELKRSKEQLEIIFKNVADGITLQAPNGRLIYANDVAARITGYSSVQDLLDAPGREILGKFEIMDEHGEPFPIELLPGRLALQGKHSYEVLLNFRPRTTGEDRWSVVKAIPVFDETGAVQFVINFTQDITEHRVAEQKIHALNAALEQRVVERTMQLAVANKDLENENLERRRAEAALRRARDELEIRVSERTAELKAANDELSTFTYIVSHDLRAPMVNLKGFATELGGALQAVNAEVSMLLEHCEAERSVELQQALQWDIPEALNFIEAAVTRMDHLTSAVLKLSRMGRRDLAVEPVDVEALSHNILDSLAHQIKQKHVRVTIGHLPKAAADRLAMEQIMGNILMNAVLYLEDDRPGEIEVTGEEDEDKVTFHVRDNGRGIAEHDRHKIFEPFRRAGPQDVPGEGMGLAYVQALVRRHNGRIWYTSHPGAGTTFSFTISKEIVKK